MYKLTSVILKTHYLNSFRKKPAMSKFD